MAKNIKKLQVVIPENTVLFDEGDRTKEMYILLKGEVQVLKNEKPLAVINATGSFIGEMATLLNAPRTAKIKTSTKSVFLRVEPEDVDTLFKVTPELGYSLSKSLAERLSIMTEKVMEKGLNNLSNSPEKKEKEDAKLDQGHIADAEKEMEEDKNLPEDLNSKVAFLTRTEVHKDIMRYYFNHIGEKIHLDTVVSDLACPEMLIKIILAEFKKSEFITITDGVIEFLFQDEAYALIESWVLDNGLFRDNHS